MNEVENKMEHLFRLVDESINIIKKAHDVPYLEAFLVVGDCIIEGEEALPTLPIKEKERVIKLLDQINVMDEMKTEEIRKAFQFAILKATKDVTHSNHHITPDAIGMMCSYFIDKFVGENKSFSIWDPVCGSSNLLTTILEHTKNKCTYASGTEIDETLIHMAYIHSNVQRKEIELFHGDALSPSMTPNVSVVVADLPVGYYFDKERAKSFELCVNEEAYSHLLIMEKSISVIQEDGYLFFIIPNQLFELPLAKELKEYLSKVCYIQGIVKLPDEMFSNKESGKSIMILQKKGEKASKPKELLIVDLPSSKDINKFANVMKKVESWFINKNIK